MGYKGYFQYIGECGHHWEIDSSVFIYGTKAEKEKALRCPVCGDHAHHLARVDETNGFEQEGDPLSWPAKMKEVGFTNVWHEDHYGNKYATKHPTYDPVGWRWCKVEH